MAGGSGAVEGSPFTLPLPLTMAGGSGAAEGSPFTLPLPLTMAGGGSGAAEGCLPQPTLAL
eukprot:scaffold57319_cov19-Phaeocystis_antarctica.AAC.1